MAHAQHATHISSLSATGGTVYHDLGNLNVSVITARKAYDRKRNLEMLAEVLRDGWALPIRVNERDDVILEDKFKVTVNGVLRGVWSVSFWDYA